MRAAFRRNRRARAAFSPMRRLLVSPPIRSRPMENLVDLTTDALLFGAAAIAGYTFLEPLLDKLGKRRQVQLYALYTRERLKRMLRD
jgi:hypothetical protein